MNNLHVITFIYVERKRESDSQRAGELFAVLPTLLLDLTASLMDHLWFTWPQ